MPCSNAAMTQKPLKFVGVPQTPEPISAVSGPKFTILLGHVGEVLLFNNFFPIVDTCLRIFGDFLRPVFSASHMQHVSDLHLKFALRHTMCGSMADIQSVTAEIRRGKKDRKI